MTAQATPPRARQKLEKTRIPGIYKRGTRYVVVARDNKGKQLWKSADTLAEAQDIKATVRTDVRRGEFRPRSQTLFTDYATTWAASYNGRNGLKEQTKKDYQAAIARSDFHDHFHGLRLSEIEGEDINNYGNLLAEQGLSPRTIRNLLTPIKRCLATAHKLGHLRANPAAALTIDATAGSTKGKTKVKDYTDAEVKRLMAAFKSVEAETRKESKTRAVTISNVRFLTRFLLLTGCRIGEALALQWRDLDDDYSHVNISWRIYNGLTDAPKSEYGIRAIPLAPSLRKELRARRSGASAKTHIFLAGRGTPLDYTTARAAFMDAANKAGLKGATLHRCRHTLASWLLRPAPRGLGASPKQAQIWLGHHDPAFTLSTYTHFLPKDLPQAAKLDKLASALTAR